MGNRAAQMAGGRGQPHVRTGGLRLGFWNYAPSRRRKLVVQVHPVYRGCRPHKNYQTFRGKI